MSAHEDGFGAPESLQPGPNDPNNKIPVSRGNIIDQLRQRVRVEAAQTLRDKSEASRSRSSSNAQDQDVIPTHSGSQDGADELSVQDEAFITSEDEQIKKNLQTYAAAWKAGQEIDPNVLVESIAPIEKLTGIQNGGNLSAGDLKLVLLLNCLLFSFSLITLSLDASGTVCMPSLPATAKSFSPHACNKPSKLLSDTIN